MRVPFESIHDRGGVAVMLRRLVRDWVPVAWHVVRSKLFTAIGGRRPAGGRGLVAADVRSALGLPAASLLGLGTGLPVPCLNGLLAERQWTIVLWSGEEGRATSTAVP